MKGFLAITLVLCFAGAALSARVAPFGLGEISGDPLQQTKAAFEDLLRLGRAARNPTQANRGGGGRHKDEDTNAFLAIRFRVPTDSFEDFIDKWKDLEDDARDEKGNIVYDLKKTVVDNIYFYHYSEWETGEDLYDHFQSDAFKDFKDWVNNNDVEWEVLPLKNLTDTDQERRETRARCTGPNADADKCGKGKKRKGEDAHVLIKYHVPPSQHGAFIDSWLDVADDVWNEDENRIYALRKDVTSNTDFYGYGTWDSFEAYRDHFETKHVRHFLGDIADQGVVWFLSPLKKYGEQRE